jgi:hypothetical protein
VVSSLTNLPAPMTLEESQNWHSFVSHTRADAPYSGLMASTRHAWNDERMDEFAARTEENFKDVRAEIKEEVRSLRMEMNGHFGSLEAKIDQRFNILFGALATGFVGAVVSHFLG